MHRTMCYRLHGMKMYCGRAKREFEKESRTIAIGPKRKTGFGIKLAQIEIAFATTGFETAKAASSRRRTPNSARYIQNRSGLDVLINLY